MSGDGDRNSDLWESLVTNLHAMSLNYTQLDDHVQLAHSPCGQKHRTKTLKLATWNIHSLLDNTASDRPERRTAIIDRELASFDIDVAALSETRPSGEGQLRKGGGYTFYWKGKAPGERRSVGVTVSSGVTPLESMGLVKLITTVTSSSVYVQNTNWSL